MDNPEDFASWISAACKLKKEDHYISVMIDDAGLPTGSISDKWKGAILVVIAVCVLMAVPPILQHFGLVSVPRAGAEFGSYTIDEKLNNVVGYFERPFETLHLPRPQSFASITGRYAETKTLLF